METRALHERVRKVRAAIRTSRNQLGDDRCHVDDNLLYHEVLGRPDMIELPPKPEFMRKCRVFHERRRAPVSAVRPTVTGDPDRDLLTMSEGDLQRAYAQLFAGVLLHEAKGEDKTVDDDRALYMLLPEQDPGDCSHPEDLLDNCDRFFDCKLAEVAGGCPLRPHQW